MIATAIVCAAAFAHGALCNWNTYAYDSAMATSLDGGTYWIVSLGASADALAGITVNGNGEISLGTATQVDTGAIPSGTYGAIGGTISGLSAADNGSYYGIVVWDGVVDGFYGKASGVVSGIVDAPPTDGTTIAFDNTGLGYGATLATIQTEPVPEPTSGLLMLLGMAGLALRRRRA